MASGQAEVAASNGSIVKVTTMQSGKVQISVSRDGIPTHGSLMWVAKEEVSAIIRAARAWGLS